MRLKQLDPKLTQQRQGRQEQTIEASIPRIAMIDAAVGRLQVQMEVVTARLDAMQGKPPGVGGTDGAYLGTVRQEEDRWP